VRVKSSILTVTMASLALSSLRDILIDWTPKVFTKNVRSWGGRGLEGI
jgi:hypothetical protein